MLSLKTYLASASIMGLAIGFGSQGLVQDVVTGVTLVFSDLIDVGEMVEISGQTGIVRSIGMRFTRSRTPWALSSTSRTGPLPTWSTIRRGTFGRCSM